MAQDDLPEIRYELPQGKPIEVDSSTDILDEDLARMGVFRILVIVLLLICGFLTWVVHPFLIEFFK